MKKIILLIIFIYLSTITYSQVYWDSVSVSPLEICLGDSVYLYSDGDQNVVLMGNDFNNGTIGVGWSSTSTPDFSNPCVVSTGVNDGTTVCWIGDSYCMPRDLTTTQFDVTTACEICFDFVMATQGNSSPCEGPDEMDEGVSLQYSIDGGTTWIDITYFCPDGNEYATNSWIGQSTAGWVSANQFNSWGNYCYNVPAGAVSTSTMFQWHQEQVTNNGYDHWGIDNVFIHCPTPGVTISWDETAGGTHISDLGEPGYWTPTQSTTIDASISDGVSSDLESFDIIVYPPPLMDIQGLNPSYCWQEPAITLTGLPIGGTFSGPGISGNQFDPGIVGIGGPYTITYTWNQWNSVGTQILCTFTTTTTVSVTNGPTADFTIQNVCDGDISTITYTGTGTNLGTYSWNFGGLNISSGTGSGPYQVYNSPGVYNIELNISEGGCSAYNSELLEIYEYPEFNFNTIDISCFGYSDGEIDLIMVNNILNYTYNWSNNENSEDIIGLDNGTYIVSVVSNGCETIDSIEILEPTELFTDISHSDILCYGDDNGTIDLLILGGTPPYSYIWSNNDTVQDLSNLMSGSYSVTITDNNGCLIENSTIISEPSELLLSYESVNNSCFGYSDGSINLSVNGGTPNYTYEWSNGQTTEDLINISSNQYIVTVSDLNDCEIIENIIISEPNELTVSLPQDFTYCNNSNNLIESVVAGGVYPYSYQWSNGSISYSTEYLLNQDNTYIISVYDAHNCFVSDSININFIDIDIEIFANNDTVCPGEPVLITTNIIDGVPPYTIYQNGNIITFPITIYPQLIENYNIEVVDACQNIAYDDITIYTYPVSQLSFTSDILRGCSPLEIQFNIHNWSSNFNYVWDFGDNNDNNLSHNINPIHIFTDEGIYDISVQVTDSNGCLNQHTIEHMIEVFPEPEAHFEIDPTVVSFIDANVDFENYSINNYYNYWSFGDNDSSIIINPHHQYNNIGTYFPTLVVETENGCKDTAIGLIIVQDIFTLYVPTAFSPDKDVINDGWKAYGHGINLEKYWIAVYGRWGELIWNSNDYEKYWDGRAKNNKLVQNGVYVWTIVCYDFNNIEYTKSGTVTVIR